MSVLPQALGTSFSVALIAFALTVVGCGGGSRIVPPPVTVTISLGASSVVLPQDAAAVNVTVTITGPIGTPSVSVSGLPAGVSEKFAVINGGPSGTLTLNGSPSAAPGSYSTTVTVNLGGQSASSRLTLISAPVVKVSSMTDTALGVNGVMKQFMSTSFQIGGWSDDYFGSYTTARETMLNQLGPQHIRVQVVTGAVPMVSNTGGAGDWNFTLLDETLQPLLNVADQSPELQIAVAPAWMCNKNGQLDLTHHLNDFAAFSANMVRYYNTGGFDADGTHLQSASSRPITWWGIFNEFNGNGLSAAEYVKLYNTVVPAMLAVDPTIKFSALEFSDYGLGTGDGGDPMEYLPTFFAPAKSGGVSAQVNIVSTHFYSSCNQKDTDVDLFSTVPGFAQNVAYFYKELKTRPDLAQVPVWVTENNVNADYADANGYSVCNPGQRFVTDQRGTSAYFAAWRPFVFSRLGKAANQALYHWDYTADQQYGEVDGDGNPFLSYWVDKTLTALYPSTPSNRGPEILTLTSTEHDSLETLATKAADGTVTVMVVDRAVHAPGDNNGVGDPRTVVVDTSAVNSFSAANLLTIDSTTNVSTGPASVGVAPAARVTVTLPGYGVAFLSLKP